MTRPRLTPSAPRWLALLVTLIVACSPSPPPAASPVSAPAPAPQPRATTELASSPEAPRAPSAPCVVPSLPTPLVSADDPSLGDADAPVTIIEFSDFQCPFCQRVVATLRQIKDEYGSRVRLVWKHEPLSFHERARPTAEAAQVVFALAGSAAFFRFHDEAFGDQQNLTAESYVRWARIAGVKDLDAFRAALADGRFSRKIDDDLELSKTLAANGTPHFFINGVELSGAQPFEKFKQLIDAELAAMNGETGAAFSCRRTATNLVTHREQAAKAEAKPTVEDKTVFQVPVGKSPTRGPKDALVTIVEFSDFQCPFCKRVEPTLAKVRETYGDDVRFVWKDQPLPFHLRAAPAAQLAREALAQKGVAGFWDVHDRLFAIAPKLEDDDLLAVAKDAGLDVARARAAIEGKKHAPAIDADTDLADDVGASGTPHFFVNGIRVVGAQSFEKFKEVIDRELEKARAMVAGGVPRAALYDRLMKDAKAPQPPEKKVVAPPPAGAPFRGGASAKVVIQEFADFQCPFCKRVDTTMQEVQRLYGKRVKLVWRHLPLSFHKDAALAAEAAQEVLKQKGQDAFWKMHERLFAGQTVDHGLEQPALETYAAELGCDMDRFRVALTQRVHRAAVEADQKAASDAGISGTPAFVINGYFVSGAQPLRKFQRVIDRALRE